MRKEAVLLFAGLAAAQSTTTLSQVSYVYTSTSTVTIWEFTTTTTCDCTSSSSASASVDPALTQSSSTTTTTSTTAVTTNGDLPMTSTSLSPTLSTLPGTSTQLSSSMSISTQLPSSSSIPVASSSTSIGSDPVVTNQAYIDAIVQNHNAHRYNHSAPFLSWSPSLAATARKTAERCVYQHDTATDGGGYGQNIGAGFDATPAQMRNFVSGNLYNGEVGFYTAYGSEPNMDDFRKWGHFTQIVWKATTSVGCYTNDCSATGLANAAGVLPFFTVCNYSPPGNLVGAFAVNVGSSIGLPTLPPPYDVTPYIPAQ
ncbi:hypothetical protein B0A52_08881 [Exophiala mesophila]|uniref:SCP domain-containing protein n=1 Tax=Exophiala mesophila TaxID=212818 RepID=A0A438MX58_EXOME|nr:hypothetical protein B0A52_08881 [Exophiala mesophila]